MNLKKMTKKVFIAGHNGMVGSALVRLLADDPELELITRSHSELNLTKQSDVNNFFALHQVDHVYLAAAKVGGIHANNIFPADFIYDNLMIQSNVINAAYKNGVTRLLLLGSSCIYPRLADQPMRESSLLSDTLEPTNEPYAIAKIAGIKLCESFNRQYGVDYRSVMPTNLYGENDNFHPDNSHVIPAMLRRFHNAKIANDAVVTVWGSGKPMREFLYVDDMASACAHVMNLSKDVYQTVTHERLSHINIGTGIDCTIGELAQTMKKVVGYDGELVFDSSKPDGAPRKLLDVSQLNELGWQAQISIESGLEKTYQWFLKNETTLRGVVQ
jgi:GDP-L-fucose synthase